MARDKIGLEINLRALGKLEQKYKTMVFSNEEDREKVLYELHLFCNEHSVLSQTLTVDPMTDVNKIISWVDKIFPPASAKKDDVKKKENKRGQNKAWNKKQKTVGIDDQFSDLDEECLDFI